MNQEIKIITHIGLIAGFVFAFIFLTMVVPSVLNSKYERELRRYQTDTVKELIIKWMDKE